MSTPRILLIESDRRERNAAEQQLAAMQFTVDTVFSYENANQVLAHLNPLPDVALVNLSMPGISGSKEMDFGFPLVFKLARLGVKKIVLYAKGGRHNPMVSAIKSLIDYPWHVDGSIVSLVAAPMLDNGTVDWAQMATRILTSES